MRILHLVVHVDDNGMGTVNAVVDLAIQQRREGHEVAVASSPGGYCPLLSSEGVDHIPLKVCPNPVYLPQSYWQLQRALKERRPDVVHCHTVSGSVLAMLARPGRRYRSVSTLHTAFDRRAVLMGISDGVIAVSEAVAEDAVARGIAKHKVRVVLNGVLGSPRIDRPKGDVPNVHHPAIMSIARLDERKGLTELVAAFSTLAGHRSTPHLYVLGEGPERERLRHQALQEGVGHRVHLVGFQTNIPEWLSVADVVVLASHREPCSLALMEARAAGCAVIGSDADGTPEVLDHGSAGLLFASGDVAALGRHLRTLLDSPEFLESQRLAARRGVERFSVERMTTETLRVYEELLGSRRRWYRR